MKITDIDKLFDDYISGYVYSNIGKIKAEEIEAKIPVLYEKFGDEKLKELDGKTPNTYYRAYSAKELMDALKRHIEEKVPVSDFLCEALREKEEDALVEELKKENGEEFTLYLMNILNEKSSRKCADRYLDFIVWDYPESVRELATESLSPMADEVKERILEQFDGADETKKECLTEVLSHAGKDDRVFSVLIDRFLTRPDKTALYAGYLGKYGDDRAIPFLTAAIENEKTDYADFEELRFNIELLGGEYTGSRDFSADKTVKKIKAAKNTGIIG